MDNNKIEYKHFKTKTPLMYSLLITLITAILTVLFLVIYLNASIDLLLILGLIFGIISIISLIFVIIFLVLYQETSISIKKSNISLGIIRNITEVKRTIFNKNNIELTISFYTKDNKECYFKEYITKYLLEDDGYKIDSKVEVLYYNNKAGLKNLL